MKTKVFFVAIGLLGGTGAALAVDATNTDGTAVAPDSPTNPNSEAIPGVTIVPPGQAITQPGSATPEIIGTPQSLPARPGMGNAAAPNEVPNPNGKALPANELPGTANGVGGTSGTGGSMGAGTGTMSSPGSASSPGAAGGGTGSR